MPEELITFKKAPSIVWNPAENTEHLYQDYQNYAMIRRVLVHPNLDLRVMECAYRRALQLVGPNVFFMDYQAWSKSPAASSMDASVAEFLNSEALKSHVVVESISFSRKSFSHDDALKCRQALVDLVNAGVSIDNSARAWRYRDTPFMDIGRPTLADCRHNVTHIISENFYSNKPFTSSRISEEAGKTLLSLGRGNVLLFEEVEKNTFQFSADLKTIDFSPRSDWYLYYVREVYHPPQR